MYACMYVCMYVCTWIGLVVFDGISAIVDNFMPKYCLHIYI